MHSTAATFAAFYKTLVLIGASAFFVFSLSADPTGQSAQAAAPQNDTLGALHRYFAPSTRDFMSLARALTPNEKQTYTGDIIQGYISKTHVQGTRALYACRQNGHPYNSLSSLASDCNGHILQELVGYVWTSPGEGRIGLFRCHRTASEFSDHYLSPNCQDGHKESPEPQFYVMQNQPAAQNCTLDGITVQNGDSRTFYSSTSVTPPATCASIAQSRTCTNGTLSGSATYQYANCSATGDTTAPLVSITAPADGATVSGIVSVTASASDNTGVERVEFKRGQTLLGSDTTSPYSYSWNTTGISDGSRTILAVAVDVAGNRATSSRTVTVQNDTADTTAPSVAITEPGAGATVSGSVYVAANANDNVGVAKVEFKVGNVTKAADTSSPYSYNWDASSYTNGTKTLNVVAVDAAGNRATSTRTVTVDNGTTDTTAPTVSITEPAAGATVSGVVDVTVSASDNVGVTKVEFKRGQTIVGSDTTSPYSYSWNTVTTTNGPRTIHAVALDAAGNRATSTLTVTVQNGTTDTTAPTVSITSPAVGATVSGTVNVSATASDNVGVTKVEFKVGNVTKATDTSAPYSYNWYASSETNGVKTLNVVAVDAAGNRATSTQSVTVQNASSNVTKDLVTDYGGVTDAAFSNAIADAKSYFTSTPNGTFTITIPQGTFTLSDSINLSNINPGPQGRLVIRGEGKDKTTLVTNPSKDGIRGTDTYRVSVIGIHFTLPQYTVSQGTVVESGAGYVILDIHPGFPTPAQIFNDDWQTGLPMRRYLREATQSKTNPHSIDDAINEPIRWESATQLSGNRWRISYANNAFTATHYGAGDLIAIKSKDAANTYFFCRGSEFVFEDIRWTHRSRGIFRCGFDKIRVSNSEVLRGPAINGQVPALSSPGGGPQIGLEGEPTNNNIVENNYFESTGDDSIGIFSNGSGTIVRNNRTDDSFGRGILLVNSPDVQLQNNTVYRARILYRQSPISAATDATFQAVLTSPSAGATVSGTVQLTAQAGNYSGMTGVRFMDNATELSTDTSSPYTHTLNTGQLPNGQHTLSAVAFDGRGNTVHSTRIVTVQIGTTDTTAPTVSITAPAAGATVNGTVSITASAADNIGVTGVEFKYEKYGQKVLANDASSPYAASFDTLPLETGTYVLHAVARDAAGNRATSTRVVTVGTTVNGTSQISALFKGSPITLKSAERLSGGLQSLTWNGFEFLDYEPEYLRGIGANVALDTSGLCYNPNDGGSLHDYFRSTSTSKLLLLEKQGSTLRTVKKMAFWTWPGDVLTDRGCTALNTTRLSEYQLERKIKIGVHGVENAIEIINTFTTPESKGRGAITAMGVHGNGSLSTFYSYDPSANELEQVVFPDLTNRVGIRIPPIMANSSGSLALGLYSPIISAATATGPNRAQYLLGDYAEAGSPTMKLNCSFIREPFPQGVYEFPCYIVVGSLTDVQQGIKELYTHFNDGSPADTIAPTVSITAPAAGNVSGTVNIAATASDNIGVARVEFKVGNVTKGQDTSSPYAYSWNTASDTNGAKTLNVVAVDAAGNRATSTRSVTVQNSTSQTEIKIGPLTWKPGDLHNVGPNIVVASNPDKPPSHTLTATKDGKSARLGFDDKGGGYIMNFVLNGTGNPDVDGMQVAIPGFGRGWQGSIRSMMHAGPGYNYNPTQAGYDYALGAPVQVIQKPNEVLVPQFQSPLFYNNVPNVDSRIRTEFDFSAHTRNATADYGVMAFERVEYYAFARNPDTMKHFPIIESKREPDMSAALPGLQPATNNDVSDNPHTIMGLRFTGQFQWLHYRADNKWITKSATAAGDRGIACAVKGMSATSEAFAAEADGEGAAGGKADCGHTLDLELMILSTHQNPNQGIAVGLYVPGDDPMNKEQTRVYNTNTMTEIRREDRRTDTIMTQEYRAGFFSVRARDYHKGILSRISSELYNGVPSMEIITNKSVILVGTPAEILAGIQAKEGGTSAAARSESAPADAVYEQPVETLTAPATESPAGRAGVAAAQNVPASAKDEYSQLVDTLLALESLIAYYNSLLTDSPSAQ